MTEPNKIDFIVSNPGHHLATSLPVIEGLRDRGVACRVLSLCELRGFATPRERIEAIAECVRLVPRGLRRSPSRGGGPRVTRNWARAAAWHAMLGPRLRAALQQPPRLVVLPNDAAFPYDRIARLLGELRIPFLLLQEGIRFPVPDEQPFFAYGAGGAQAIAAWGEASAEFFRRQGVAAERIHLTGSPRFDRIPQRPSADSVTAARARWRLNPRTLILLTNPIDDLGFATPAEKLALVGRFLRAAAPMLEDPDFSLAFKPHGREDPAACRALCAELAADRLRLLPEAPLEELFCAGSGVVVLASTVGLEALLHGLPLGVLELPGHGFQYDYVSSGVAQPLSWSAPMAPQIDALLRPSPERMSRTEAYLRLQLATRHSAAARVVKLALRLAGGAP